MAIIFPRSAQVFSIAFVLWASLVLLACNLGTPASTQPPTLVPRASATPPPTLGYTGGNSTSFQASSIQVGAVGTPVPDMSREMVTMMEEINVERMMRDVRMLESFHTRHVNSAVNQEGYGIGAARRYIADQFQQIATNSPDGSFTAHTLDFDLTYDGVATRQQNVLGVLTGTTAGGGYLVIGAHYDSIGPDFQDPNITAPGANDNGSGVAGLLEIARVMSQRRYRASVIFVAFSAEEVNRVGSKAFVSWARSRNMDITGMINLDSIGNANDVNGNVNESLRIFSCEDETSICTDPLSSRHMARTVEYLAFANEAPLPIIIEDAADRQARYGDHFSFTEVGYPAIRFINAFEEWGNGSSLDLSQYIEPAFFRRATQSILLTTVALADAPTAPGDIVLRDNGNGSKNLRWESVDGAAGYVVLMRRAGSQQFDNHFEWSSTSVDWEGFDRYAAIAVAARSETGLIGQISREYVIQPGA